MRLRRGSHAGESASPPNEDDESAGSERRERQRLRKKSHPRIRCMNGDATNFARNSDALTRSFYLLAVMDGREKGKKGGRKAKI